MELGDPPTDQRTERGRLDLVLDKLNGDLTELVEAVESGGLDQLDAAEKMAVRQRFETFRNRLPLIDHSLIADAEATDLAGSYCSSSLTSSCAGADSNNDPKSTPASDASTPNANRNIGVGDDRPTPHEEPSARAEPLVELCGELRHVRQRFAVDGSDRNRPAEAAGPEGAA